jgi:hypothetical protein
MEVSMSLLGKAFVIMWHDIAAEGKHEYQLWHTRQHMPERLSHRGFLRSRRGVNLSADRQQYFTVYEGETLETFTGDDYARSLNHPTEWTRRVAPHFRNFLRMSCAVTSTRGRGIGGALATFRGSLPEGRGEGEMLKALEQPLDALMQRGPVTGVHVAVARPEYSGGLTRETELRPQMHEAPFDIVVMVEGVGLRELEADASAMRDVLAPVGLRTLIGQCYDVAYVLERDA